MNSERQMKKMNMSWIVLILGNIVGGFVSSLSWKDRGSVPLRIVSIVIPVACGAFFWYLQYKSGYAMQQFASIYNSIQASVTKSGINPVSTRVFMAVITAFVFTFVSKVLGIILAKVLDK